ncbi:MAG: hypothetical protein ATN35_00640 [Epulopiscium sp. Nele67-Bin004]|nr:MAG: hypothetical protein ATN35_00640 [Epulopiscium sp. Nele67-Bin004]
MNLRKSTVLTMVLVGIIALSGYFKFGAVSAMPVMAEIGQEPAKKSDAVSATVVIDPGHGGYDPGKVGASGYYEKDINLEISLKLKKYLEDNNKKVVMTRETDADVDGIPDKFIKNNDMRGRKEIVNASDADIVVSIHQNAFTQASVKGAQVFYYNEQSPGKALAQSVQNSIKEIADPNNTRQIKSSDYYLLRMSDLPSIIVECGFLTNPEEEQLLRSEEYQDKMAQAIYLGIEEFLVSKK